MDNRSGAVADIVLATDDHADNMGPMINPKLFEGIFVPQLKLLFSTLWSHICYHTFVLLSMHKFGIVCS